MNFALLRGSFCSRSARDCRSGYLRVWLLWRLDATVTSAQTVAPGAFKQPRRPRPRRTRPGCVQGSPAFCRVTATLKPSSDSISRSVWLSASGWVQKHGVGRWLGRRDRRRHGQRIRGGYATSSPTRPCGRLRDVRAGASENRLTSVIARCTMTVKAKAVIAAYYGSAPKISY